MKKALMFFVILMLLLTLPACGNGSGVDFSTDEFLADYDYDPSFIHSGATFCIADNIVYFSSCMGVVNNQEYIGYTDLNTGVSGPLCGKPECDHSTSSCNAYVKSLQAGGLSFYNGRLYWLDMQSISEGYAVYSVKPDGTDRTTVQTLDYDFVSKAVGNRLAMIHRGYLFVGGSTYAVEDGVPYYGSYVCTVPLDGGSEGIVILDQQYSDPDIGVWLMMQPYRTGLYIMVATYTADGRYTLTLYRWDIVTQELETLYDGEAPFIAYEFWVTEDGIFISDTSLKNGDIYRLDLASGELGWLFNFYTAENEHFNIGLSGDMIIGWTMDENSTPSMRVTDLSGKVLFEQELNIPGFEESFAYYILCGAKDESLYLYFAYRLNEDAVALYGNLCQISMDTGEAVMLWSGQEDM